MGIDGVVFGYEGFLFVGDPHLSSTTPGRRKDRDFCLSIMAKLEFIHSLALREKLKIVILGDLFDDDDDCDPLMLTRLIRVFNERSAPPLSIIGNHEKRHSVLTDDTAMAVLRESGVIETMETPGMAAVYDMGGVRVGLGGSPFGNPLPSDVREQRNESGADFVVWLSHHDMAFAGAYPGALPIVEIAGVDMLVNGHMHKRTPSVVVGGMVAHNPGNITRMSVDCANHVPSVSVWRPSMGVTMETVEVPHGKDVFDLTGLMAKPITDAKAVSETMAQAGRSKFAALLKEHSEGDFRKSDSAVYLKEDLEAVFLALGTSAASKALIYEMLSDVLEADSA